MYESRIVEVLHEYKAIFYWIEKHYGFTEKEAGSINCSLCEMICGDFAHGIFELRLSQEDSKKIYNYIKNRFFEIYEVKYIEYKQRVFDYFCLSTSIVPSEIGQAWIMMLRKDYRLTLEIMNKLRRLYHLGFRKIMRDMVYEINKIGFLSYGIGNWHYDGSKYSKLYRMKLMLEKNMELNNLIYEV